MSRLTIGQRPGRVRLVLILAVIVLGAGAGGLLWWRQTSTPKSDLVAALRANNRGVGHMERFEYPEAAESFREAVRLAPDWTPARINLGIALLNMPEKPGAIDESLQVFHALRAGDPHNIYAAFCAGIIYEHLGKYDEALGNFMAATLADPTDSDCWYRQYKNMPRDSMRRIPALEQAVRLKPAHTGAVYALAMELRETDMPRAKKLLEEYTRLQNSVLFAPGAIEYPEMGRYANVIGRPIEAPSAPRTGPVPLFVPAEKSQVQLAAGAKWASASDLGSGPIADLRRETRKRFGGTIVFLDFNQDGKTDILCLGAVVENGAVRDLLLRNDGGGHFTDVTREAGLAESWPSLGCCVGDFDNDGFPDLFFTGAGQQRLLRNNGKGRFVRVTGKDVDALDKLTTVCLGAQFVDLDQDGDLDLVVTQYAETPEAALAALKGDGPKPTAGLAVFINTGEARPAKPTEDPPPLTARFERLQKPDDLVAAGVAATGFAVGDLDQDGDADLLVVGDGTPALGIANDRLLRFHRNDPAANLIPKGRWNGALTLDTNHDGRPDLFLVGPGQKAVLLTNQGVHNTPEAGRRFDRGVTNAPNLLQAQAIDLDLDGWVDVVGLSEERRPVLLHNDGSRLVHTADQLGAAAGWPRDLLAVAAADLNDDGRPDLLIWSEAGGLELRVAQDNGNRGIRVDLTGHRRNQPDSAGGKPTRSNRDGVGTVITAQVDDHWTSVENTTHWTGLGQSRIPLILGLGRHDHPDVVRLRWPDNVIQAEFNIPTDAIARVDENNRKGGSCPVLFAWNGKKYAFVTDFLGAGSMGELGPDGSTRPPRPEESVKIEAEQLVSKDGRYVLKLAEPMDEVTYLDRLQLMVLDHPADVRVYPDERFVSTGASVTQELIALREEIFPVRAQDHHGRDVTAALRQWDRDTVDDFSRRSWVGFAEEHWVELDFGDRLSRFGPSDRLVLCAAGWTDYAYPETIWAAAQAGVSMQPPVLERKTADGRWEALVPDAGFPAGLPRMTTLDVTGRLGGPRCVLRLRTNMHIFWDQIFISPVLDRRPSGVASGSTSNVLRAIPLEVCEAILASRGYAQEFSPDGRVPTIYDYDRLDMVPVTRLAGKLTRFGPVTELLRAADDRFVLFGPGDDLTVRFDATSLPPLPAGWKRSFVLKTWGYCKDCGRFTATGSTVEPLPFRAMSKFPYGADEHYPKDAAHEAYRRDYNTRQVGLRPATAAAVR